MKLEQFLRCLLLAAFAPVVIDAILGVLYLNGLYFPATSSAPAPNAILLIFLLPYVFLLTPLFLLAYLSHGLRGPRFWVLVGIMLAAYALSFVSYVWFVDLIFPAAPYFWFAPPAIIMFLAGYALGRLKPTRLYI